MSDTPRLHFPGQDEPEAQTNIADAIKGYLESLAKYNEPIPPAITEEIIDVA